MNTNAAFIDLDAASVRGLADLGLGLSAAAGECPVEDIGVAVDAVDEAEDGVRIGRADGALSESFTEGVSFAAGTAGDS